MNIRRTNDTVSRELKVNAFLLIRKPGDGETERSGCMAVEEQRGYREIQ